MDSGSGDLREKFVSALAVGFAGKPELALNQLQQIEKQTIEPVGTGYAILYQAVFLGHLARIPQAREQLAKVRQFWGNGAEAKARIETVSALLDEAEGDRVSALRQLNHILDDNKALWTSEDARDLYEDIQLHRGRILATEKRWFEALPILEEGLNFESFRGSEFYFDLGRAYFETSSWAEAEKYLRRSLSCKDLDDSFAYASHYYLGRLLYRRGSVAEAVEQFKMAEGRSSRIAIDPRNIYDALAKSYRYLGAEREARHYAALAHSKDT